jgi:hypothetical protein
VPLYTKCFKCGGWREMPAHPTKGNQIPTGLMKSFPEPPENLCSCHDDTGSMDVRSSGGEL